MEFFGCWCEINCEGKDGEALTFGAGGDAINIDDSELCESVENNDTRGFLKAFRALGLHCTFSDSEIADKIDEMGGLSNMKSITLSYQETGGEDEDDEENFESSYSIDLMEN